MLLALASLAALGQDPAPSAKPPADPLHRVVTVEIGPDDPILEGRGPTTIVDHLVEFPGTLYVWARGVGLDPFLRVETREGTLLKEGGDASRGKVPCVVLKVAAGDDLVVHVALRGVVVSEGSVDLHLVGSPDTEATLAAAGAARGRLVEITAARERGELEAALGMMRDAFENLISVPEGERSASVHSAMAELAQRTEILGDSRTTVEAWRRVQNFRQLVLPEENPSLQGAREHLALAMRRLGNLKDARALQEKILEIRSRTLDEDHPDLQRARLNLAATMHSQGDLMGARELGQRVLAIRERTLPEDHADLQYARGNLAMTLAALGDLVEARALEAKVLSVFTRTLADDHPSLQQAREHLAVTLAAQGDLLGSMVLEKKVLAVYTRILPEDHPDLQSIRQNLAATMADLGDLGGARPLFEKVLEVRLRTLPDDHRDIQVARLNLAAIVKPLGDLTGARALEESVLDAFSRNFPDDHSELQVARQNLAATLFTLGDTAGARALFEKVLEIRSRTLPDDHLDLQIARINLAEAVEAQGDHQGSRVLEEKVLEVFSRTLSDDHPHLQAARANLASTLRAQGDNAGARLLLEKVLEVRSRALPEDHPHLQMALGDYAETLEDLGDLESARVLEDRVLGAFARILPEDHPDLAVARANLAWTLVELHNGIGARAAALDLARGARQRLARAALALSSREAESTAVDSASSISTVLSIAGGADAIESSPELNAEAFVLVEAARGIGLAFSRAKRLMERSGVSGEISALRHEIELGASKAAQLAMEDGDLDEYVAAMRERERSERKLRELLAGLDDGEKHRVEVDPTVLASLLSDSEAAVGYWRYTCRRVDPNNPGNEISADSLIALVVRAGTGLTRVELGTLAEIEAAVETWRRAVGSGVSAVSQRGVAIEGTAAGTNSEEHVAGEVLRRLVFDPLGPALGGTTRVYVTLDDVLHLVPLDALPERDRLLGERVAILVIPTLATIVQSEAAPGDIGETVIAGGINYEAVEVGSSGEKVRAPTVTTDGMILASEGAPIEVLRGGRWVSGFLPLPGTVVEAREIASLRAASASDRSSVTLLEGGRASREALLALAPRTRFLHLATHGYFAPDSVVSTAESQPDDFKLAWGARGSKEHHLRGLAPMVLCGLALAGANRRQNGYGRLNGLITAEELSTFDLSGCELAVLSACDTNVGIRRAGQGVASLQKALHMAGARSVITSLWKVPDEATKELMLDFYRRLWVEKKPKWQSLWEAKMKLRSAKDEQGRPIYSTRDWAAWVLTGNPD